MKTKVMMAVLAMATVTGSFAQEKPAVAPEVLRDGDGAKSKRIENMNGTRFIEIFLASREPKTGDLVAPCYNTMLSSKGIPASKDTAPQALVEGLDLENIAKEHGVLKASLNGPKIWFPDWIEIDLGKERDFNGMSATWAAQLNMNDFSIENNVPYKPTTIERTSKWGWSKGTTVLILDDAEGNAWVMKGMQLGIKPQYTYEQFVAAGASNFKKLPPGWKFRIKTLEEDLIEIPEGGVATIMPDEFFNMYDKTGPGMTNYQP